MKGLTDVEGILVGHASDYDGLTGCTAIICPTGAVAGGDLRGSGTGTVEWDLLNPLHLTTRIHAVVFAGGSAFGLEASSGVRNVLERQGIGFETGAAKVPLVVGAILYDLHIGKAAARPTREMGEAAALAATDGPVQEGACGAGTGATIGKMFGPLRAMKSGIGSFTQALAGPYSVVKVSALAAVNALGDVVDPHSGLIVAGARVAPDSMEFADSSHALLGQAIPGVGRTNTTLVSVATNAALTKAEATKLAQLAQLGMARAIRPVNTSGDGDAMVALSVGAEQAPLDALGVAAAEATVQAILRAVRQTSSLGGAPGLKKD